MTTCILRSAKTYDAPIVLYYKGKLKQLDNTVGIVGARRCTREARAATIENAKEYSMRNVVVVIGAGRGSGALIPGGIRREIRERSCYDSTLVGLYSIKIMDRDIKSYRLR